VAFGSAPFGVGDTSVHPGQGLIPSEAVPHHVYGVFPGIRTEKDPAYMSGSAKIHFIFMLCFSPFNHGMIDQCFCYVVCNQLSPDFLLNVFRFIGMKVAQPNRIFQLSERALDSPSPAIKFFDFFHRKRIFL